jgi:transcription-repair coupling factor (superfamily II helicase)
MRDLEIRGSGNLLGTKQSGHIAQIGFELYCQLLKQSVERLKGRKDAPRGEATFKADFIITTETQWVSRNQSPQTKKNLGELGVLAVQPLPAFLPASWLTETQLRIAAYRELSEAGTEKAVDALETSWRDRFGRLPEPTLHLLHIARIKALAAAEGISSVEIQGQRLMLHRGGDYILLEGRRFPRLKSDSPHGKLAETMEMLRTL